MQSKGTVNIYKSVILMTKEFKLVKEKREDIREWDSGGMTD